MNSEYFTIHIPMHVYYFLMNHMSWMIGPNPFENGCQLRKKEKSHGKDLPHLTSLLFLSYHERTLIAMNGIC